MLKTLRFLRQEVTSQRLLTGSAVGLAGWGAFQFIADGPRYKARDTSASEQAKASFFKALNEATRGKFIHGFVHEGPFIWVKSEERRMWRRCTHGEDRDVRFEPSNARLSCKWFTPIELNSLSDEKLDELNQLYQTWRKATDPVARTV